MGDELRLQITPEYFIEVADISTLEYKGDLYKKTENWLVRRSVSDPSLEFTSSKDMHALLKMDCDSSQ